MMAEEGTGGDDDGCSSTDQVSALPVAVFALTAFAVWGIRGKEDPV